MHSKASGVEEAFEVYMKIQERCTGDNSPEVVLTTRKRDQVIAAGRRITSPEMTTLQPPIRTMSCESRIGNRTSYMMSTSIDGFHQAQDDLANAMKRRRDQAYHVSAPSSLSEQTASLKMPHSKERPIVVIETAVRQGPE